MHNLYMLVGLPRAGKTTWREENKEGKVIVSADDLRLKVYGQPFFAEGESLLWSIRDILFRTLLEQGHDIIVDETNLTGYRRRVVIKLAKKYGYYIECIVINAPVGVCIKRAGSNRELVNAILRMAAGYEEPNLDEGIDRIWQR